MDVDRFTRERSDGWKELAGLVREAGTRPQRLGAEPLLRLGRRYRSAAADPPPPRAEAGLRRARRSRSAAADLALARRLFPNDPQTRRLERLVADARQCV